MRSSSPRGSQLPDQAARAVALIAIVLVLGRRQGVCQRGPLFTLCRCRARYLHPKRGYIGRKAAGNAGKLLGR